MILQMCDLKAPLVVVINWYLGGIGLNSGFFYSNVINSFIFEHQILIFVHPLGRIWFID